MNIIIYPHKLTGSVTVPSSKSMAHRMLICAALSRNVSRISGISFSKDIDATLSVMRAFGAEFEILEDTVIVSGISNPPEAAFADCCESGSTLRFLIPVAAALGIKATFAGQGRLPQRPITPYLRELSQKGITFDKHDTMPFTISGKLTNGLYHLEGDISSQFVTGLLLSLPLLTGNSDIMLTSPLQSKPYADMTIHCMHQFGVLIREEQNQYHISGNQHYLSKNLRVEGDFSQAAFFYVANAIGNQILLHNIPKTSVQGDRAIISIIQKLCYHKNPSQQIYEINAENIPDLVPILAVLATFMDKPTHISGAARLRIKESDRLASTAQMLNTLGGNIHITSDGLEILPVTELHGGTVSSAGDHRIAMCAAIAATRATDPVIITGAECVEKSYPAFFEDYQKLGGILNVINLE